MKKLFSMLSGFLCVILLTAPFSSAPDAYALCAKATKELHTATSAEMTLTGINNLIISGHKFEDKTTVKIKIVYISRNKVHLEMKYKVSGGTQFTVYYKDGYSYVNMYGMKMRQKADMDDIFDSLTSLSNGLTKANLSNAKIENVEQGYKVRYLVKSDTVGTSTRNSLLESLKEADLHHPRISLSDFQTTLVISKDNHLKSFSESFSSKVASDEGNFTMQSISTLKINSLDKIKSIDFPSDLSNYTKY